MATFTQHLVRRGLETMPKLTGVNGETVPIPGWGLTLLAATGLFFALAILSVDYTWGNLVVTLASIETPRQTAIVTTGPAEDKENPDAPLLSVDEKRDAKQDVERADEVLVISQPLLTSRFRTIGRHLRSRAGRLARFRGIHIFAFNSFLFQFANHGAKLMSGGNQFLAAVLATVSYSGFAQLQLLWTHVVITEPSSKSWLQRFPSWALMCKAIWPTMGYAAIVKSATLAPHLIAPVLGVHEGTVTSGDGFWPTITYTVVCIFIAVGIVIPAEIAITRVRASLLTEADGEPIVPFDRTFGGQVVPESAGGKGVLTLKQAIQGCDMKTRYRVLGVYLKTMGMQLALMICGVIAIACELMLIFGPDYREKMMAMAMAMAGEPEIEIIVD